MFDCCETGLHRQLNSVGARKLLNEPVHDEMLIKSSCHVDTKAQNSFVQCPFFA